MTKAASLLVFAAASLLIFAAASAVDPAEQQNYTTLQMDAISQNAEASCAKFAMHNKTTECRKSAHFLRLYLEHKGTAPSKILRQQNNSNVFASGCGCLAEGDCGCGWGSWASCGVVLGSCATGCYATVGSMCMECVLSLGKTCADCGKYYCCDYAGSGADC